MAKKKKTKKKKAKLTEEQKIQRKHISEVRSIFNSVGFVRVDGIAGKNFIYKNRTSEFDDVFIFQNIVIFLEYTKTQSSGISAHLLSKKVIYDHILNDPNEFLTFCENEFPTFKAKRDTSYTNDETKVFILYSSRNEIRSEHKLQVPNIKFLDYYVVQYFKSIAGIIKSSSRYEFFKFLEINYNEIGENISPSASKTASYEGSLLPESYSNYDKGYKIVSFYIDPKSLIEKSYVLRKYGWQDDHSLYQRMIISSKIKQIRKYLNLEERVFINNIIITLPNTTKLLDKKKNTVDPSTIKKTQPVEIQVPNEFNVIGLIDGQHRVFAYHEGGENDEKIKKLREKQNLLVTGIIYPSNISDLERTKFEAKLFLEINSNQANAKSDLKQAIGLILKPFAAESISRAVLEKLNKKGSLEKLFEVNFFDKGKIKTTSIVSYGMRPLLKLVGTDSLFQLWNNKKKETLKDGNDETILSEYLEFSAKEINLFLGAARLHLIAEWGITDKKNPKNILNTTTINGLLICLRKIIEHKKTGDFAYYQKKLQKIKIVTFLSFKSSQYGDLGELIYKTCF